MKQLILRTVAAGVVGFVGLMSTGAEAVQRSFEITANSSFSGDFTGILNDNISTATFKFSIEDTQADIVDLGNRTRNNFDLTDFEVTVGGETFTINPLNSPAGNLLDLPSTFRDRFVLNPIDTPDSTSFAGQTITGFDLTFLAADGDVISDATLSTALDLFATNDFFDFGTGSLDFIDGQSVSFADFEVAQLPVPEPATWIMMIVGFGLIGMQLQRGKVGKTA